MHYITRVDSQYTYFYFSSSQSSVAHKGNAVINPQRSVMVTVVILCMCVTY